MLQTAALLKTIFAGAAVSALLTPHDFGAAQQRVDPASYHHGLLCLAGGSFTAVAPTPVAATLNAEVPVSYLHSSRFQRNASAAGNSSAPVVLPALGSTDLNHNHAAQSLSWSMLMGLPTSFFHGILCQRGKSAAPAAIFTPVDTIPVHTPWPRHVVTATSAVAASAEQQQLSYTHGIQRLPTITATATGPAPAVPSGVSPTTDEADPVLQGMYAAQSAQERAAVASRSKMGYKQQWQQEVVKDEDPVLAAMYAAQRAQELAEQAAAARTQTPTAQTPAVAPAVTQTAAAPTVPPVQSNHDFRAKPAEIQAGETTIPAALATVVVAARGSNTAELRRAVHAHEATPAAYEQLQTTPNTVAGQRPNTELEPGFQRHAPEPEQVETTVPVADVGTVTVAFGLMFVAALALGCAWLRTARTSNIRRRRSSVAFSLVVDGASNMSRSAAPTGSFRQRKRCSSMGMGV